MKNALKRTLTGVTALTLAACAMPANVGGFLTGNTGIVANAAELCVKVEVSGKTIELECDSYDFIEDVKAMIHEKEGILPEDQVLYFAGRQLFDYRTLADYKIPQDATLQLFRLGEFTSASLSLGDDLGLNFIVAGINRRNASQYTVKFSGECINKESGFERKGYTYRATAHIHAKNMNEAITATIYKGDEIIDTCTYSVNQYLDYQIENPSDSQTTTIVNATKKYGMAAENYFKNAENELSFRDITEDDLSEFAPTLNGAILSLVLENETAVRLYVKAPAGTVSDDGQYTSKASSDDKVKQGYLSFFEITNLTPGMLDKEFTVTAGGVDYKFSALSWVYLIMKNRSSSLKNVNMAKAIFEYHEAAKVFNIVDLSKLKRNYSAHDGDILTGTLGGDYLIYVDEGAKITLKDATINPENVSDYDYVGAITCYGDATITLKGTNIVKGPCGTNAGIYVGSTLTINGTGSLDVIGGESGAGIGSGMLFSCGSITINGGTITATGRNSAAGIGTGTASNCGDITINGGTVIATGGEYGSGIGGGDWLGAECGDITINGGTVYATGGNGAAGIGNSVRGGDNEKYAPICGDITINGGNVIAIGGANAAGIGSGNGSICGNITINDGNVTATGGDNSAGIGCAYGFYDTFINPGQPPYYSSSCGDITISGGTVTATKGKDAPYSIGEVDEGTCGTVTINGVVGAIEESPYTYEPNN